jgi:uncharacterized integral membrane protein
MTDSVPPIPPEPPLSSVPAVSEPAAKSKGMRPSPKFVVMLLIVAAVLWFAFANTRNTQIKLWVHTVQVPVWLVLLCTFVAGVLVGMLLRRRRKNK